MKKGQFALEFVILISFTLLFSAVLLVIIQRSYIDAQRLQQEDQIDQIMRLISAEVNMAELSPQGYVRTFYIPSLIDGKYYNLNSSDDVDIVFYYNERQFVYFLPNSSLKGACSCLKPGYNTIKKVCPGNSVCVLQLLNPDTLAVCPYFDGDNCMGTG